MNWIQIPYIDPTTCTPGRDHTEDDRDPCSKCYRNEPILWFFSLCYAISPKTTTALSSKIVWALQLTTFKLSICEPKFMKNYYLFLINTEERKTLGCRRMSIENIYMDFLRWCIKHNKLESIEKGAENSIQKRAYIMPKCLSRLLQQAHHHQHQSRDVSVSLHALTAASESSYTKDQRNSSTFRSFSFLSFSASNPRNSGSLTERIDNHKKYYLCSVQVNNHLSN